ncbi:MAG: SprT-like domain-containing protein [Planctomycetota bacterium]
MLPPQDELECRVTALFELWRVPAGAPVPVRWNERLRTTAGRAFPVEQRIELNPALLQDHPDELEAVLVHEAAHLAAARLFGPHVAAHGRHWRALMRLAGHPPDVTHDLPVPRRRRRRSHVYLRVCDVCGDRRIARVVRYDPCACGSGDRFLVLRAPASDGGLRTLRGMSVAEVRRRCATG